MLQVSAAFTPVHSFLGGLMLASGVHFLLRQAGTVLGISGFFHEAVSCLVSSNDGGLSTASSPATTPARHAISPEDDAERQSQKTYSSVSRYFIVGMLAGGASLAAARVPLESALGTAIFDSRPKAAFRLGHGLSRGLLSVEAAHVYVPSALWGMAVGFGTKLGSGCTSGHFLCGLSRLSIRSAVATATFFSVAVATHLASHPLVRTAAASKPSLPAAWAVLLLQTPAFFYIFVVPYLVQLRLSAKKIAAEERKLVHTQAVQGTAFLVGLHFSFGLAMTGMTRPSKVLGFFNFVPSRLNAGAWDPSLAMVALGGIIPSSLGWFLAIKPRMEATRTSQSARQTRNARKESVEDNGPSYWLAAPSWRVPDRTDITWQLLLGAALFGVGWGMTGLCPGPALTAFGASTLPAPQDEDALLHLAGNGIFVGAMALGGLLAKML